MSTPKEYYFEKRQYLKVLLKNHHNILVCLDVAFSKKDINLIFKNTKRLNDLTRKLLRDTDLLLMHLEQLQDEVNHYTVENRKLMDEAFLNISEEKGRYQEAKKMLDEFYNGL
jgi:hypothetical protein